MSRDYDDELDDSDDDSADDWDSSADDEDPTASCPLCGEAIYDDA